MALNGKEATGDLPDEQLMKLHQVGNQQAFDELVSRYHRELYHYLARLVNNRAAAEDIFQETFLQVHVSASTFDTSRRFRPWLFTIATNKARDQLRRNTKRATASLSQTVGGDEDRERSYIDLMEVDVAQPSERAEQEETRQFVREVVEKLPPNLREVLLLAYFHRFSYKQIAEMIGVPIGTVKSRLHTAVGTFADRWKQRFDGQVDSGD